MCERRLRLQQVGDIKGEAEKSRGLERWLLGVERETETCTPKSVDVCKHVFRFVIPAVRKRSRDRNREEVAAIAATVVIGRTNRDVNRRWWAVRQRLNSPVGGGGPAMVNVEDLV